MDQIFMDPIEKKLCLLGKIKWIESFHTWLLIN